MQKVSGYRLRLLSSSKVTDLTDHLVVPIVIRTKMRSIKMPMHIMHVTLNFKQSFRILIPKS